MIYVPPIYHCRNLDGQIKISCKETGINQIAIGGGVSANLELKAIKDAEQKYGWKTYVPKFEYTDNAAMIGIVGYQKFYHNNLKLLL
jgi:N6-L-threonylcarbamoyladenine synthase